MDKTNKKFFQFKNNFKVFGDIKKANKSIAEKIAITKILNELLDLEFTNFQRKNLILKMFCEKCKYSCNNLKSDICCNCNDIDNSCSNCEQRHEERF